MNELLEVHAVIGGTMVKGLADAKETKGKGRIRIFSVVAQHMAQWATKKVHALAKAQAVAPLNGLVPFIVLHWSHKFLPPLNWQIANL